MDIEDKLVDRVAQKIYETWAEIQGVRTTWEEVATRGDSIALHSYQQALAAIKATTSFVEEAGKTGWAERSDAASRESYDALVSAVRTPALS